MVVLRPISAVRLVHPPAPDHGSVGLIFFHRQALPSTLMRWVDAVGCAYVTKGTQLGTGEIHLCASARAVRSSVQNRQWAGTLHWRYGFAHRTQCFPQVLFDLRMPQGLTHIHRTALMRCVRCAAHSEHMVSLRACRDIVAYIIHSVLSMRSRL